MDNPGCKEGYKYWIYTPEITSQDRQDLILLLKKDDMEKTRSHYIMGRWENIYISLTYVPQVKKILSIAGKLANNILDQQAVIPYRELGYSHDEFWFNIAKPGQSTAWHDHKEGAVLSGVYYVDVPEQGGNIKFRQKTKGHHKEWSISSKTGRMVFFPSALDHAVEKNESNRDRISLSFNFFALPLKSSTDQDDYSASKYYG
ncbi:MAG: putative 2OG-Fe(II) oxygenase [Candidatus Neomarinimicrobiota bacterium]|nr:putative 2OG-Fe(II) oxygenase [Candidatus Neomarinimicrobiota bacterium]